MSKRLLVTGSRTWTNQVLVVQALWDAVVELRKCPRHGIPDCSPILNGCTHNPNLPVTLVHGGAEGADAIAHTVWGTNQHPEEVHLIEPTEWEEHGKRAGYLRNKRMVDAGADLCVAFIKNQSRGATMTAAMAENAGIPTWRITE